MSLSLTGAGNAVDAAGGGGPVTWGAHAAGISLDVTGLIATHNTATADEIVISSVGLSSGTPSARITVGVTTLQYVGLGKSDLSGPVIMLFNGDVYGPAGFYGNSGLPFTAGDFIDLLPNLTTGRMQFSVNGSAAYPSAGGGVDISSVALPLYVLAGMTANGVTATGNFAGWA